MLRTGVIADDLTGATDIACAYALKHHRAAVAVGPSAVSELDPTISAIVVALKSRTAPLDAAVDGSLAALRALQSHGCERFVFKYCSTFDSTDRGNIGPVLDALSAALNVETATVVPAFPDNARTVYMGHLFVGSELLEHSSMRHHPLTPMTKSRIADILRPQTTSRVGEVHLESVRSSQFALSQAIVAQDARYIVLDALSNRDLAKIHAATCDYVLVSGASGIALGTEAGHDSPAEDMTAQQGGRLVVCGSASAATRAQISNARQSGCPMLRLDVTRSVDTVVHDMLDWLRSAQRTELTPVIYTAADRSDVTDSVPPGDIEHMIARVTHAAVRELGVRNIIVAGGETAGAVVDELGIRHLLIGPSIANGVCWSLATTANGDRLALALKSGNFGGVDMFTRSWEVIA
jgi:uncharacterized protein YgbK (DUF1537 family)